MEGKVTNDYLELRKSPLESDMVMSTSMSISCQAEKIVVHQS